MAVSKKRTPYVKIENRAFQQVYDDLNDVIDNVNQYIDIESSNRVLGSLVPKEDLSYDLGDENNSFKNVYAEKFYGDGSALTGVSGGGGSGDITEVASGGGLTGGSTSGVATLSHADTSTQISSDNLGQQFIQNISLDTYGHISSLTSSTAIGASFITAGTATPSTTDVADKTPTIGDVYIQYNSNYVSNGTNNQYASTTNAPIIYVRVSDEVVLKMYNTGTNYRCKEHVDNGYTAPTPASASITFCNSSGSSNLSSYYLVGQSLSAYAKCTYNSDVTGGVTGTPQADFNVGSNKDFDTSNNTRTSSANTSFSGRSRDSYLSVGWVANGATEGGIAVADGAGSDTIYARNKKLWGACTGIPNASALSSASSSTSSNTSYHSIGTKSITNTSGQRVFFAIPNGTTNISSIKITGNPTNQIGAFSTTTATYTNSNSYAETYKIWYSSQQGASTTSWEVG